jgi:hypothetical protein
MSVGTEDFVSKGLKSIGRLALQNSIMFQESQIGNQKSGNVPRFQILSLIILTSRIIHGFLINAPSVQRLLFSSEICPALSHGRSVMADENQLAFPLRFLPPSICSIGIPWLLDLSSCCTGHDFGISYAWARNVSIPISAIHQNAVVSPRANSLLVRSLAIPHCSTSARF